MAANSLRYLGEDLCSSDDEVEKKPLIPGAPRMNLSQNYLMEVDYGDSNEKENDRKTNGIERKPTSNPSAKNGIVQTIPDVEKLDRFAKQIDQLQQQNLILVKNMSRLFLTAKRQLADRNNEIRRLETLVRQTGRDDLISQLTNVSQYYQQNTLTNQDSDARARSYQRRTNEGRSNNNQRSFQSLAQKKPYSDPRPSSSAS